MAFQSVPFYHCNGGEISRLALARVDIDKMRLAAERMVNWMPLTQGPMTLRPGTRYIGNTYQNNPAKLIEFVYASDDAALIEVTDTNVRIWANDALVSRDLVTSTIPAYSGWTMTASTGSTVTVNGGGHLVISGVVTGNISSASAAIDCTSNSGMKHGLRFTVVQGGDLGFKLGTTLGADDLIPATTLGTGTHSIGFVPGVNTVYVQFESRDERSYEIDVMTIEGPGAVILPAPWRNADLPDIRYDQSADVVAVACHNYQQRMIQRRDNNSWSIVLYETDDGPFPAKQGDKTYKFTPSDTRGDITLTCNKDFFKGAYVGSLIRLFHEGQSFTQRLNVQGTYTDSIRVSGVADYLPVTYVVVNNIPIPVGGYNQQHDREFQVTVSGVAGGTVIELQRTYDPDGLADWVTVETYSSNVSKTYAGDTSDNVIVYYRLFCRTYGSGTATCGLSYTGSGGYGICRIRSVTNATTASCQVLKSFANTVRTDDWRLSDWNGEDGYPSSVTLHEGRLWWSGATRVWGSVSDNFTSFDFEKTGAAAPISRSIGKGPIQNTRFMLSINRLVVGTDAGIVTARSSSFDEPLTPTNFVLKYTNTQGVLNLRGLAIDTKGIFVQRSGRRIYLIDFTAQKFDYTTIDLTRLNTDIGIHGFVDFTIQRQFDTRLWFVRGDGMMAVLVYDEQDDVVAWYRIQSAGSDTYENVAVLPATLEDSVYAVVNRSGSRFIEKFARLDEAQDSQILSDACVVQSAFTNVVTGLDHLESRQVVAWGDGKDLGTYTVSGGQITLSQSVNRAVVGLKYTAQFISAKLAYAAQSGTAINKAKRVSQVGFVLDKTYYQGVRYGQYNSSTGTYTTDQLPLVEDGVTTAAGTIWGHYDQQNFDMNGQWSVDSRIYLEAASPCPATVLGFTIDIATSG
jgi:hypothetical protein